MAKENLLDRAFNKYSQAGQDGILEYIFNVLDIEKGFFAEFGAWDGLKNSNCRKLFEEGWSGIFIESHNDRFLDLQKNYKDYSQIVTLHKMVRPNGEDSFDSLMDKYAPDQGLDFLCIDIDGPDLEIFESIEKYLPKVAMIEGGKGAYPFDSRMPAWVLDNVGQSLKAIDEVAKKKGYKVICSYQDTILVKQEYAHLFKTSSDLMELYINGYKAQTLTHIPMYINRLKIVGRRNKILEYVLKQTNYYKYSNTLKYASSKHEPTVKWAEENQEQIIDTLNNLPQHLKDAYANTAEKFICITIGLALFILRKIKKFLTSNRI